MTARALLREVANHLHEDKPHPLCDVLCQEDAARAAALRVIADRLDMEMESAAEQRRTTADFGETDSSRCLDALCRVLERLDASPAATPLGIPTGMKGR